MRFSAKKAAMLRRFAPILTLLLAACASDTGSPPGRRPQVPSAARADVGKLAGLGAGELGAVFGTPALQVREGSGLKLQFRGGGCILDAYLYPSPDGHGVERVTYVEARLPSGAGTAVPACAEAIERSR